ncbi:MAG: response regulator receiver modulated diguanylate phosphodiesterase [Frankiales bacterium]|nr:response regulator receiver modulated diguanylate phosphodiesterase [Frankiales bacterium]
MIERLSRFADAKVLVIDDNANNLALLEAILFRAGLSSIYTESDSREVARRLPELNPDLIVLDLHMPNLDGFEVLRQITEFARGAYLPVLVVSADSSRTATYRALESGAQDFLNKPFDNTELVLRIRNLLHTRFLQLILRQHSLHDQGVAASREMPSMAGCGPDLRNERIDRALKPGGIDMSLQAIVDSSSWQKIGFEALSRFSESPLRTPDVWFAEADDIGRGIELELCAVSHALESLPAIDQRHDDAFLSINVSPATLLSQRLEAMLPAELCPRIVLELTEHVPVENYDAVLNAMSSFRERGVRLAIDDTGAGYASFRHLLSLRPEIIKLDISLTRGVDTIASHRALASALVIFAEDVGARILAEGVETGSQARALRSIGITWMQGFYFGVPEFPRDNLIGAGGS